MLPSSAFACWHLTEKSGLSLVSKYQNSWSTQHFTQIHIYLWWKEKKRVKFVIHLKENKWEWVFVSRFPTVCCKLAQGFWRLSKVAYWNTLAENEPLLTALSKTWWSQSLPLTLFPPRRSENQLCMKAAAPPRTPCALIVPLMISSCSLYFLWLW